MNLLDSKMKIIANNIKINKRNREYIKIRNSISVLNFAYLEKSFSTTKTFIITL